MTQFVLGITCIGSGVGQSIITALKNSKLPLKTIGLGTNPYAYGAYDCDEYDYSSSIYHPEYVDDLISLCTNHGIQLLIPSLDNELPLLAQHRERFEAKGIQVMVTTEEVLALCRDKARMSRELNPVVDIFVQSYEGTSCQKAIQERELSFPFISKPRGGFASRGINIIRDSKELDRISEEDIVQALAIPASDDPHRVFFMDQVAQGCLPQVAEISIQLVFSPEGNLMGKMASYNKLQHGVPIEILPYDHPHIWEKMDLLIPHLLKLGLVGPLNLQGRMTDEGLKIFEMNPRFTGISGLRAKMGFNEVEACVKEWLGIQKGKNRIKLNYALFGTRQTSDKAISIKKNSKVQEISNQLGQRAYTRKERVFITGATGNIGQLLVETLLKEKTFDLLLYSRRKEKLSSLFGEKNVQLFDKEDFDNDRISFGNIDIILHLGHARPANTEQELANSVSFTSELFTQAVAYQIPTIINISSQSVYDQSVGLPWKETDSIAPLSTYGMAKYMSELMLASLCKQFRQINYTSIRLGSVVGGKNFSTEVNFLNSMIQKLKKGEPITVQGGQQILERLDVRDAVSGIIHLLKYKENISKPVYNLGSGEYRNLLDIVSNLSEAWSKKYPDSNPSVSISHPESVYPSFGIDSQAFRKTFHWTPKYTLTETIQSLI